MIHSKQMLDEEKVSLHILDLLTEATHSICALREWYNHRFLCPCSKMLHAVRKWSFEIRRNEVKLLFHFVQHRGNSYLYGVLRRIKSEYIFCISSINYEHIHIAFGCV